MALVMVIGGSAVGLLLSPKSKNIQKGEQYESGIPTRGTSWMQFKVGYYLIAILFLMFDVEAVLLFPWAVLVKDLGVEALYAVSFFLVVLILGLAYAWRKGGLEWK
ncbi:MAG: NADH-quinone oxidoreductase subunit A [Paludibacteraceae bacterium]|nr:NADH-quinone oxidoreductase subunit A [Paludibacteraceae bacterium]